MRNLLFVLGIIAIFGSGTKLAAHLDYESSLVGYWKLDEVRTENGYQITPDATKNNNHGVVTNAVLTSEGKIGNGYNFDGDDIIQIADASLFSLTKATFSLSAWIKPTSVQDRQRMIVGKTSYANGQREWGLMQCKSSTAPCSKTNEIGMLMTNLPDQANWRIVDSKTVTNANQWYHIIVSVNQGNAKLYINGKLEHSDMLYPSMPDTLVALTIGAVINDGTITQGFFGTIDEVALWNRALGENEVTYIYENGIENFERLNVQ